MAKGVISLFILLLVPLISLAENLRSGDLIFVTEGSGDFSKAISETTASSDSLKFIHVGIIETTDSIINVIEASPEEGVRIISLESFIKDYPNNKDIPAFVIKRLKDNFPVNETIARAKSYLGQPYDWWYLPHNGKIYCSELVYESYLDEEGQHIFSARPMNFRTSDGEIPEFWIDLFKELGQPVPEGIDGTNPSDLSKSPRLKTILNSTQISLYEKDCH